jgi:hypothetical protein
VLLFNRDEQRSRKPALPPIRRQRNGVSFLVPTDADHGGTWMMVNTHGLSVCLLNHYPAIPPPRVEQTVSRGTLVLICADSTNAAEVMERGRSMDLAAYQPFQLVAVDATGGASLTWDGRSCTTSKLDAEGAMLSSSSFHPDTIVRARRVMFSRIVGPVGAATADRLEAFHRHRGDDPAAAVRMSRPDACTHSIARIVVSEREGTASFYYEPQSEITPAGPPLDICLPLRSPQACS